MGTKKTVVNNNVSSLKRAINIKINARGKSPSSIKSFDEISHKLMAINTKEII
jgi:hypothetical protein